MITLLQQKKGRPKPSFEPTPLESLISKRNQEVAKFERRIHYEPLLKN